MSEVLAKGATTTAWTEKVSVRERERSRGEGDSRPQGKYIQRPAFGKEAEFMDGIVFRLKHDRQDPAPPGPSSETALETAARPPS